MCDVEAAANAYFGSLNPLSKKFQKEFDIVVAEHEGEWENLSWEQQDELLDARVMDPEVAHKYDEAEECQCFPKLVIRTGEKIVADFDNNDVYTWRDEHSGPFSWKTKSQQDLSLILDDDTVVLEKPKTKPVKKLDRDLKTNFAFKPEKSIWDSPFLVAEKGLGKSELFESDELFEKFTNGFTVSAGGESQDVQSSPSKASEDSKLLSSPHHENRSFQLDEPEDEIIQVETSSSRSSPRTLDTSHTSNSREEFQDLSSRSSLDRLSSSERRQDRPGQVKKWRYTKKEVEAEQALMSDMPVMTGDSGEVDTDQGQVSPAYIEDPGESFTEDPVFNYSAGATGYSSNEDVFASKAAPLCVVTSQPVSQTAGATGTLDVELTSPSGNEESMVESKTGFDFLDNW